MCLILVKQKGIKFNDKIFDYISQSWKSNSDGGGFAKRRKNDNSILIRKGFKNSEDMITTLDRLKIAKDDEVVMHMRFATHGSKGVANMHPFIIRDSGELIAEPSETCVSNSIAFFHNGVMSGFTSSKEPGESDWSDTRIYAKHVLAKSLEGFTGAQYLYEIKKTQFPTPEEFNKHLNVVTGGNKFALLSSKYGVLLCGDFIKDSYGIMHSSHGVIR